jgi:hypothetical protein
MKHQLVLQFSLEEGDIWNFKEFLKELEEKIKYTYEIKKSA